MTSYTSDAAVAGKRLNRVAGLLLASSLCLISASAHAQTALADSPLFANNNVPGNLGLLLSVEFPTAVSVAHTNRTYSNTSEYLGFFDPGKCYDYRYSNGTSTDNYFYPNAVAAANHICTGKWSGNFLNWASMQTIDPFRWVLTGGYRVIDTATLTVLEKAYATGQGGASNFPNSTLDSGMLAGATPFPASMLALYMRIQGLGNKMRFTLPDTTSSSAISFTGQYYNNTTFSGTPVLTRTDAAIDFSWGSASPGAGVNADNFSVSWKGSIKAPTAGNYRFQIKADDTLELWINGTRVINQTSYQSNAYQTSSAISFTAGQTVDIVVKMTEGGGDAGAQLQWKRPGDSAYSTMGSPVSSLEGSTATHYNPSSAAAGGTVYEVFMRAKVCDSAAPGGVEANCVAYGSNWKPEGLLQKYANRIRYSAFGYLNDSNILRDGGVLRAKQKFVGPSEPVPGSVAQTNTLAEWSATTGVFIQNPNPTDASATNTAFGTSIADSGVINYLNKFGELNPGSYKTYDNVSELYYAAVRYFKNQGNVPEWTNMSGASAATKTTYVDGFPVITDWVDPILYSCQRNFLLGIGDVNTHADKNVPGNTSSTSEPNMPAKVLADSTVDAVAATNKVGALEGLGATLGTSTVSDAASYRIAGLAYDSHTKDIRADLADAQTIDTYWVDVMEYQSYANNNQFYLATKYGGFKVPAGYDPYGNTTALTESWWHTNSDTLGSNKRPDNYFSGGRPDLMKTGLEAAFADIASKIKSYTTSFSTALPQVSSSGNKSYSSQYDASTWIGEIVANSLSFDPTTGDTTTVEKWRFADLLADQIKTNGWSTNRRIVTWDGTKGAQFCSGTSGCNVPISAAQFNALETSYVSGVDNANYLNYLRGDTTNEQASTASGSTKAYRTRAKLLGDIVGSKARPIGPPSFPFSDSANPGYSAFKSKWALRPTVVYVGANDGMMHAIHGDLTSWKTSGAKGGTELFAYVPNALFTGPNNTPNVDGLASLGNPSFSHHFMVNATPDVFDIDFARTPDASKQKQTPASTTSDWHSVLIGGLGKGGRSYYAIDVTDPEGMASGGEETVAGKVLWEFTDTALGYTYGAPIVAKTVKYGWVVIIPSGYNPSGGVGRLLIINPKSGALLETLSTGAGSATSDAGLAFANAFVVDSSDGTMDAVYAGDLLGNLWRADLTGTSGLYPDPLKIATLTDSVGNGQPVTARPLIEVHPTTKRRFVMVGTGRLLDSSDISSKREQSFYAIVDGTNAKFNASTDLPTSMSFAIDRTVLAKNTNPLTGVTFDTGTQMGWVEDLGTGAGGIAWRVISDATSSNGSIAWAATLPSGDACNPSGTSLVYARDYATAVSQLRDSSGALISNYSMAGTVTDLHYLSVDGKLRLVAGNDLGTVQNIPIDPQSTLGIRRLNWRELLTTD